MSTWKRRLVDAATGLAGVQVARKGAAWVLIEPEQLHRFLTHFRVDCVFDVGANVGQYASKLRDIGYTGQIISFEPIPEAAAAATRLASRDPKWVVNEIALDSESRDVSFNIMQSSQFSSLHRPDHSGTDAFVGVNEVKQKVEVRTRTLAELFPALKAEYGFERPFLKMDTQGHDVQVTLGAGDHIKAFVGLQSELGMTKLYDGQPDYHEALEHYKRMGFKLSGLIPNNAGHFPDLNEVDCLMYNPAFL
jgi:FkbM family methyltransferase